MPIILDFSGKLVLVTGGGRSIGLAIARAIAKGWPRSSLR
jgi:NAD(P)-dependent dehydrogenase (short-subunit alcohol dehydrogenase family)